MRIVGASRGRIDRCPWVRVQAQSQKPDVDVQETGRRSDGGHDDVNMTISLAFVAPSLIRAALEGRLPRGINIERPRELPAEWNQQFESLGLDPAQ
jgi:hypothetical protein